MGETQLLQDISELEEESGNVHVMISKLYKGGKLFIFDLEGEVVTIKINFIKRTAKLRVYTDMGFDDEILYNEFLRGCVNFATMHKEVLDFMQSSRENYDIVNSLYKYRIVLTDEQVLLVDDNYVSCANLN